MSVSKVSATDNQTPRRAWYMWTDSWCDAAAKKNPLRWGSSLSLAALLRELSAQDRARHVRICLEMTDGRIDKEFSSTASAVLWLRGNFHCDVEPTESRRHSDPPSSCIPQSRFRSAFEDENFSLGINRRNSISTASSDEDFHTHGGVTDASLERCEQQMSFTSSSDSERDVARLEDKQASQAVFQYMWADAGSFLTRGLAEANPLRWSTCMRPQEVADELGAAFACDRPVKLIADAPGYHEVKTFDNTHLAVRWIREEFKIEQQDRTEKTIDEVAEKELHIMIDRLITQVNLAEPPCGDDTSLMDLDRKMLACYGGDKDCYVFIYYQGFDVAKCERNDVMLLADPIRLAPKNASPQDLEVFYHYTDSNGFPLIAASRKLLVSKDAPRSHFGVGAYGSKKAPHEWLSREQILANNYRPQQDDIDACANDHLRWETRVASRFCGRADFCVAFIVLKKHRYDIHKELEANEKRFHETRRLHEMIHVNVSCNKWGELQPKERDVLVYNDNEGNVIHFVYAGKDWRNDFENKIKLLLQTYSKEQLAVLDSSSRYLRLNWIGRAHIKPQLPQLPQDPDAKLFPLQIKAYDPLPDFYEGVRIAVDPFSKVIISIRTMLEEAQQLAEGTQYARLVDLQSKDLAPQIEALMWHLLRQDSNMIEAVEICKGVRHLYRGDAQQQLCNIYLAEFIINRAENDKDLEGLEEAKNVLCGALNITHGELRHEFRKFFGEHVREEATILDRRELERRGWCGIAKCLTEDDELKEEILFSIGKEYSDVRSPYHPKTIETNILLADTMMNLGKKREARNLYKKLRELRALVLGNSHKLTRQLDLKLLQADGAKFAGDSPRLRRHSSSRKNYSWS